MAQDTLISRETKSQDLARINYVVWTFLVIGTVIIIARFVHPYNADALAVALIWATACLASGSLVGFLFGIPRVLQTGEPTPLNGPTATGTTSPLESSAAKSATAAAYRQQVNTNLVEISDWLTKIIVGLGLVNLKDIPDLVNRTASTLAHGLAGQASCATKAPCSDYAFAIGLVVAFGVAGFLIGYLYTRLFLAGAFWRADNEPEKELLRKTEGIVEQARRISAPTVRGEVTKTQVETAERVSALPEAQNLPSTVEALRSLAREYERIRFSMLSGPKRTTRMEKIVETMQALALAGYGALGEFARSASAGDRLVAVAMLQLQPNPEYFSWLVERVTQEKPFLVYHALVALRRAAETLDDTARQAIRTLLEDWLAKTPDREPFQDDPDRAALLRRVLELVRAP